MRVPEDFFDPGGADARETADRLAAEALVVEVDGALEHHELIKVKVAADDREARDAMIADLVERTDATLVQRIGHTAVLYRPSKDKRHIVLPRG